MARAGEHAREVGSGIPLCVASLTLSGLPPEVSPLSLIEDHEANLRGLKFRRTNLDLISMDANGVVRAADLRPGNPSLLPARLGVGGVKGIAAARDLDRFAIWSSDHRLRVWSRADDRFTPEELPDVVPPDDEKSEVARMAWGELDERLALATSDEVNGARVQLWSVPKNGIPPSRIAQRNNYLLNTEGRFEPKLCLSEDGARLAVVLDDQVEVLDAAHALELINTHRLTGVDDVAFLHGHRRLLIAAREGTSLIDPDTGERSALPRGGPALSWHWAAPGDGPTFAVTLEAVPWLVRWDDDGAGGVREAASVPMPGETEARPLALSGDARWLAVAMRDGKVPIVRLLDAALLKPMAIPDLRHDEDRDPRR